METRKLIDMNKKAAKLARDIRHNELSLNRGIWKTETAKKRHERLTTQLEKLDAKIDEALGE